jgi:membrane protease subunit HflK
MSSKMDLPPQASVAAIFGVLIVLAIAIATFSSFFTVPAESEGVVLRFGKYNRTVPPGLHFKMPFGIESAREVQTARSLKLEFGFGTGGATNPDQSGSEPDRERLMVTGDLNAALVEWVVQYRISDPRQYLFRLYNPAQTLRALSESVMREVVGDRTIDEVLTFGRQEMEEEVRQKMDVAIQQYELGVRIDQIQLKNVNPPQPVQQSFDEVNRAQQEREQMINVARGEFNRVVPRARGEADQKISEAEGYALQRVNQAKGDVARFVALFTEYSKAPEATRKRLYLETMSEVLGKVQRKIIIDDSAKSVLPLLQLQTGEGRPQ